MPAMPLSKAQTSSARLQRFPVSYAHLEEQEAAGPLPLEPPVLLSCAEMGGGGGDAPCVDYVAAMAAL